MKEFYDTSGFRFQYYSGEEVQLPDAADKVEVVRYAESELIRICKKSTYKESLLRRNSEVSVTCESTELTSPTYQFATETVSTPQKNGDYDITDDAIVAIEGELIDARTGEHLDACKHENNLRRAWNTQTDKVLASLHWQNTLYVTATLDGEVSFERMRKAISAFRKWTKKFCNFKFCGYFLEPHSDGNWHVHFLIYFTPLVPDGFENDVVEWWDKQNGKPCDNQVKVTRVEDNNHLINILIYHKPTCGKKKHRIKYYPLRKQPMGCFGDVRKPECSLEIFETVQQNLGGDFTQARSRFEKYHPDTGVMISYSATYIFESNPVEQTHHLSPQASKTDMFACYINGCSEVSCFGCSHHGCCRDCLGAICDNLCAECVRKQSCGAEYIFYLRDRKWACDSNAPKT